MEIPLDKPLMSQILLDGKVQRVEYENLPAICFLCGKYGHVMGSCPDQKEPTTTDNPTVVASEGGQKDGAMVAMDTSDQQGNPNYGPCMIATKRGRPRLSKEGGN